jgi:ankyrin repeat protein
MRSSEVQDQTDVMENLLKTLHECEEKHKIKTKEKVWKMQPMMKAFNSGKFDTFCLLNFVGGPLGNVIEDISKVEDMFALFEENNEKFSKASCLTKWWIASIVDEFGNCFLSAAADVGKDVSVRMLIDSRANLRYRREADGDTLLYYAIHGDQQKCAEILIDRGAEVNVYNFEKETPLHYAAHLGKENCGKLLISRQAKLNEKQKDGFTPLHYAVQSEKVNFLRILLNNGADVEAACNRKRTPLHLSAENGNADCAEALIAKGAEVNAKDEDNWTSLHFAARNGKIDCLRLLLASGADINAKTKNKKTPLRLAGEQGNTDCVELLIEKGAEVDAEDSESLQWSLL